MVLLDIVVFILSLIVLVKGADYFISSASRIAGLFGIPEFFIGLTLVAVGTSLPEFATSVSASISGKTELALGNIIGSNIANIGLVLGISAIWATFKSRQIRINQEIFNRDGIFLLLISVLFFVFAFDGIIHPVEGLFMLLLFILFIVYLYKSKVKRRINYVKYMGYFWRLTEPNTYLKLFNNYLNNKDENLKKSRYSLKKRYQQDRVYQLTKQFLIFFFGLFMVYAGAKYIVPSSANMALILKVPESVIALLIIAVGTSLPELVVSITAVNKGLDNILIGDILGSNIANILLVGSVSSLITPLIITPLMLVYLIPAMIFMVILLLLFIRAHWIIKMFEGLFLLLAYIFFVLILFAMV